MSGKGLCITAAAGYTNNMLCLSDSTTLIDAHASTKGAVLCCIYSDVLQRALVRDQDCRGLFDLQCVCVSSAYSQDPLLTD